MISSLNSPVIRFASQPSPQPGGDNLYDHISTAQVYDLADKLVLTCQSQLADPKTAAQARESIGKVSNQLKSDFKNALVNATAAPAAAEQGRLAATQALVGGLIAGALDTLLIMNGSTPAPSPQPPAGGDRGVLSSAIDHMMEELKDGLEAAKDKLKTAGVETLQAGSEQGKSLGESAVQKAGDLADGHWSLRTFQGFDASTFALGYSVGIADGALVSLGLPLHAEPPAPPAGK